VTDGWGDSEEWEQIESRLDAVLHGDVESLLDESLSALRSLQDEDDGGDPDAAPHHTGLADGEGERSPTGWTAPEGNFDPSSELAQVLDNLHRMGDDPSLPAHPVSAFPATPKPTTWTPVSGTTPVGYGKTPDISGAVLGMGDTAGLQPSAESLERLEAATAPIIESDPIADATDFKLPPPPQFNLTGPTTDHDPAPPDADLLSPAVADRATDVQSGANAPTEGDSAKATTGTDVGGAFDRAISSTTPAGAAVQPGAFGRALEPESPTRGAGPTKPASTKADTGLPASGRAGAGLPTKPASTKADTGLPASGRAGADKVVPGLSDPRTFGLPVDSKLRTRPGATVDGSDAVAATTATDAESSSTISGDDVARHARQPARDQPPFPTSGDQTRTPKSDGENAAASTRRWPIGRRKSKPDVTDNAMPLSQIVPAEIMPPVTTSTPPGAPDGAAQTNPLPAGTKPTLTPKVARPKNKNEASPVEGKAPPETSARRGLVPPRRTVKPSTPDTRPSTTTTPSSITPSPAPASSSPAPKPINRPPTDKPNRPAARKTPSTPPPATPTTPSTPPPAAPKTPPTPPPAARTTPPTPPPAARKTPSTPPPATRTTAAATPPPAATMTPAPRAIEDQAPPKTTRPDQAAATASATESAESTRPDQAAATASATESAESTSNIDLTTAGESTDVKDPARVSSPKAAGVREPKAPPEPAPKPARPERPKAKSTLALFAEAGAAKKSPTAGEIPAFETNADVFSAQPRSTPKETPVTPPPADLFSNKTDANAKPPTERAERVRGRAPIALSVVEPSSRDELAESLEIPRRGLGFLAGLLLLIIGLGAVAYALIATAGNNTGTGTTTIDTDELVPIDPHTVDVRIDGCDENGVTATLTNSSTDLVYATVQIQFVGESNVLFHNGTLRAIEVAPADGSQFKFQYVEDLVPAELQGETYQCSVEVQSVSTAG